MRRTVGEHIRRRVIPVGMTVTEAAKRLGVSRVGLSNLLNGRATLSQRMALRLRQRQASSSGRACVAPAGEGAVRRPRAGRPGETPLPGTRVTAEELTELTDRLLDCDRPRAAFNVLRFAWDGVETSRLRRLLNGIVAGPEPDRSIQLDAYDVCRAIETLNERTGVTRDEMADLEFVFFDVFRHTGSRATQRHAWPFCRCCCEGALLLLRRRWRRLGRLDLRWSRRLPRGALQQFAAAFASSTRLLGWHTCPPVAGWLPRWTARSVADWSGGPRRRLVRSYSECCRRVP